MLRIQISGVERGEQSSSKKNGGSIDEYIVKTIKTVDSSKFMGDRGLSSLANDGRAGIYGGSIRPIQVTLSVRPVMGTLLPMKRSWESVFAEQVAQFRLNRKT